MTVNQLLESALGKACALEGEYGDATPFTEYSTNVADKVCARLEELGMKRLKQNCEKFEKVMSKRETHFINQDGELEERQKFNMQIATELQIKNNNTNADGLGLNCDTPISDFKYGWEKMYSGFTGEELKAKVFIGPTYYQRLKHLVSNKIHSRSRGRRTLLCHQPSEGGRLPCKFIHKPRKNCLICELKNKIKMVFQTPITKWKQ